MATAAKVGKLPTSVQHKSGKGSSVSPGAAVSNSG